VKNAKKNRLDVAESSVPGIVCKGSNAQPSKKSAQGSKAKQGTQ
jgi:hypothetical protein